jgi:hypothetical protein
MMMKAGKSSTSMRQIASMPRAALGVRAWLRARLIPADRFREFR